MGIFNFLNKNKSFEDSTSTPIITNIQQEKPDIPERIFIANENVSPTPEASTQQIVDNNINLLFSFLDRNHENKGYEDALVNPDVHHLNQNLDALRNELIRTVNKVKTFYEDFIKEIDYHIDSRSRSGMVDTVEELKMKKEIAENHIRKVLDIEASAINNTGDSQGILLSYAKGFRNGLAAISHHAVLKRKL